MSNTPFDFVASIVEFHATGNREPELLVVINRYAWAYFHDPAEPPPSGTMTGLERELFLLRTCEPFASVSEVDLLTHQQMAPMLVAEVGAEVALHEAIKCNVSPLPAKKLAVKQWKEV